MDLGKTGNNTGEEGRLETVGPDQDAVNATFVHKREGVVRTYGTTVENWSGVVRQKGDLATDMVGLGGIYRLPGADSQDGLVDKKAVGNIDVVMEKGFDLLVQIRSVQTDNGGDGTFQKQACFESDDFGGLAKFLAAFGVTDEAVIDEFSEHIGGDFTGVFTRGKMRNVLGTGDDGQVQVGNFVIKRSNVGKR